jgi:hypothetical protein
MGKIGAFRIWLMAWIACAIAQVIDILSSLGFPASSGFAETNPLTRHADGTFWLYRGAIIKAILTGWASLASVVLYLIFYRINRKLAIFAAVLPLIYQAYCGMEAGMQNLMLHTGWYVDLPRER